MTAHEKAAPRSQRLCDLLYSLVEDSLAGVQRTHKQEWCPLKIKVGFGWVSHRREWIQVFLKSGEQDGPSLH